MNKEELTRFNMDMIRSIVEAREVTVLRQGEEKKILLPELSLLDVAKSFISALTDTVSVESTAKFITLLSKRKR